MTYENHRASVTRGATDLRDFFTPGRGIAIIGRIDNDAGVARLIARYGADVKLCFVNPKGGEVAGVTVYHTIDEVPGEFSVALLRVGPANVVQVVRNCAAHGIRRIVIFSSGFSETGPDGAEQESQLAAAIAETGVRVIGPNTADNMFEQFAVPDGHRGGLIGLVTQSGAMGRPIVEGIAMGAAFSRWITVGNEVDLEIADVIGHFTDHDPARVIAGYVEGFKSLPRLRAALSGANRAGKPVVMLKIGESERGARMAASHTGHLSGNDAIVQGLFDQHGVTRVRDLDELLETANLFAKLPPETGSRAALYSVSGGTATLMAEIAGRYDVDVPVLAPATQKTLARLLPGYVAMTNPIDNGGQFTMNATPEQRRAVFDAIAADPAIDVIVVGFNAAFGMLSDNMAADVRAWVEGGGAKPVIAVWSSVVTEGAGYADLVASGVPIFRSLDKAFRAIRAFGAHRDARRHFRDRPPIAPTLDLDALETPGIVEDKDAAALLKGAGVSLARQSLAASAEAAAVAELAFPRVLKLSSPDFPHRSDLGLVMLGIDTADAVRQAFDTIIARAQAARPDARIEGVLVQEQIVGGVEMLVGLTHDPHLGPAITIGAGGIHAEILRDVSVRPLPVDEQDIREMIGGLRIAPLLAGARGRPPADLDALVTLALAVAGLGLAAGSKLAELDLNPVIALPDRAVAVDALMVAG
ncbi:acetate--CoA ligase family protein [Sphingomonas colocasiae]|uniref:Acetate--CoA ligase family protein n=1 Tax=Sphingomonas colocasiae TaxID=1848973 RepID=A0ABS7PI90_9SPHN|nr:acetate--CoA ligase family protein [Sphingomonas colocasiae]MBY8821019.1 acetate--CoA ligase family protein [Sphingomonas colocasiae]